MRFRPGDVTDKVRDGVATMLIRGGIAEVLDTTEQGQEDVHTIGPARDEDKQADSGDGTDIGTDQPDRGETPIVPGGERPKPRRRTR